MVLLKENGLEGVLPEFYWPKEHTAVTKRLFRELYDARNDPDAEVQKNSSK